MGEFRAAYRYANAFIGVAVEIQKLDEITKDVVLLEKLIVDSGEFRSFLKSPVVNSEKKKIILQDIFKDNVHDLTLKFILLVASKGKEGILDEIVKQFRRLRDERLGILLVKARSAVPFTPVQEQELSAQIGKVTKKKIQLTTTTDPDLMGGFTIQYEDTVWNASVRHQLELLRNQLIEGTA